MSEKYINLSRDAGQYGGYTSTTTSRETCNHKTGGYITVRLWIFSKSLFVCSDCGHHKPVIGGAK